MVTVLSSSHPMNCFSETIDEMDRRESGSKAHRSLTIRRSSQERLYGRWSTRERVVRGRTERTLVTLFRQSDEVLDCVSDKG